MWRNYFLVGFRALTHSRTYAFINIFGLAIGLAACLLLFLYVRYESRYDAWLPNAANTYQLQARLQSRQTGAESDTRLATYVVAQRLRADFPQVERAVYAHWTAPVIMRGGEALPGEDVLLVDDRFFDILQFPFASGDPRSALAQVNSAVLTQTEARRIFGREDVVGRTLTLVSRGLTTDFRITGIVRDPPRDSHLALNIIARIDFPRWWADQPEFLTSCWDCQSGWVYFALLPGTDPAAIQAALPAWERRNIPSERSGDSATSRGLEQDFRIANIRDIHLGAAQEGAIKPGNDRRTIATFSIIAFLILAMASINFVNLATARAGQRAREVALRKVLGARRKQLVAQFLGESVLITSVAMIVALAMVELALPWLNGFLHSDLVLNYVGAEGLIGIVVLLTAVVGLAGGAYPAFYLSRFQPAAVLKANTPAGGVGGSSLLRNGLVVAQFAVSIGLIVCAAIVYSQTVFARTVDPGYRRDGLIQSEFIGRRVLADRADSIVAEFERVPGVVSVGRSSIGVATRVDSEADARVPGLAAPVRLASHAVDLGFFRTMGIEPVAGRLFEPSRPGDDATLPSAATDDQQRALAARGVNVVVNELAARRLGFRNPAAAIGRTADIGLFDAGDDPVPSRIIGVVRDSRFRTVREPIEPIVFRYDRAAASNLLVRYDPADRAGVRRRVEQAWRRLAPDVPFGAEYSEDRVAGIYESEQSRTELFTGFAMLAILVAALGLYGLAAFTAERRTREIGIRKVLGARTGDIVRLLAWQFSKPVIVANLIAWPVAWWVMRDWLNTFDARIDLGPTPFVVAGLLALVIAIGTIAGHALRVARANPIHALRYE